MTKKIEDYQEEVYSWAIEKGWENPGPTFPEAVALLHSEVSEALEEYRVHGLGAYFVDNEGNINTLSAFDETNYFGFKPMGVPSELADIFVRLCHYSRKWDISLRDNQAWFPVAGGYSFADYLAFLHMRISMLLEDWFHHNLSEDPPNHIRDFPPVLFWDTVYSTLLHICHKYNINLFTEYEAKMSYNKTREYRHGGKKL